MVSPVSSVSALWIGSAMTPYEHLCLSSFVRAGYEVRVFTYDPGLEIPQGAQRYDASAVLPAASMFENHRERGTFAAFSNIFRYRLLQLEDTTWIDTDVMLVGDSLPVGSYLFGYEDPGYVNSAIFRAPMDSPFLAFLFDRSSAADPSNLSWGQIGPKLVTEAVTRFDLHHLSQPAEVLYPLHYREVGMLFDPSQYEAVQERLCHASTLHLWNEIMRRGGPVKQVRPPKGSWLAHAFDSHDIEHGSQFEHDVNWVRNAVDLGKITVESALAQRDIALRERDSVVAQRDTAIRERTEATAERDAAIAQRDAWTRRFGWLRGFVK